MDNIFENTIDCLKKPEFEKATKIHDWRNYVPDQLIEDWNNLTMRERQIIYFMAEERASIEEWD